MWYRPSRRVDVARQEPRALLRGCVGQHDLSAVTDGLEPGRQIGRPSVELTRANRAPPGVESDPDAQLTDAIEGPRRELPLHTDRAHHGPGGVTEDREHSVATELEQPPALVAHGCRHDLVVIAMTCGMYCL